MAEAARAGDEVVALLCDPDAGLDEAIAVWRDSGEEDRRAVATAVSAGVVEAGDGPGDLDAEEREALVAMVGLSGLYRMVDRWGEAGAQLLEEVSHEHPNSAAVVAGLALLEGHEVEADEELASRETKGLQRRWAMKMMCEVAEPWALAAVLDELGEQAEPVMREALEVTADLQRLYGERAERVIGERLAAELGEEERKVAEALRRDGWQASLGELLDTARRVVNRGG